MKTIANTLYKLYKYGVPSYILSFGDSLGDNLLLTVLARELHRRGFKNVWIKCNHADLFLNNPFVKLVLPYQTLLSTTVLRVFGVKFAYPRYTSYQADKDQDVIPEKHIVLKMADSLSIKGDIEIKPVFELTPDEVQGGRYAPKQIVIASSGTGALVPMKNKEWLHERYQQIINRFSPEYTFLQLGSTRDPAFDNVTDLRGKTSVRQSAAILKNAELLLSHVGFLMHLARAVDCRSVIVYGGREKPAQSGYNCFENIYSAVPCAPCWFHSKCDYNNKCMSMITAEEVSQAVINQLSLANEPLDLDILMND
jgi:hypothetical protein